MRQHHAIPIGLPHSQAIGPAHAIRQPVQSVRPCLVPAPVRPHPCRACAFLPTARVRTLIVVHAIRPSSPVPLALRLSSSTPVPSSTPCLATLSSLAAPQPPDYYTLSSSGWRYSWGSRLSSSWKSGCTSWVGRMTAMAIRTCMHMPLSLQLACRVLSPCPRRTGSVPTKGKTARPPFRATMALPLVCASPAHPSMLPCHSFSRSHVTCPPFRATTALPLLFSWPYSTPSTSAFGCVGHACAGFCT